MDKYIPTLRTLHRYPDILPKLQVDRGAVKFVLGGANIFCKGLTSEGARMDTVEADTICAIMAEGKTHALAIGLTKMSSEEM
jgi:PUA domain protein